MLLLLRGVAYVLRDEEVVVRGCVLMVLRCVVAVRAVVEQAFVKATEPTDLRHVEQFMLANGFVRIRNNDYLNPGLGIILEDLHDENVLTSNGVLYFIDTVFYLK